MPTFLRFQSSSGRLRLQTGGRLLLQELGLILDPSVESATRVRTFVSETAQRLFTSETPVKTFTSETPERVFTSQTPIRTVKEK